tara:strand:- start:765 stop:1148 length:384 start_codon:yes stop_codon:yes gene_type:complete
MLYNFPLEIQRLIYSYDSTYKERMKESFIIIKNLPISENYMNIPLLLNIQEISDDAMIISNGSFINIDDDNDYYNESIDYDEIERKKLKRLNDGASIVLDDENSIKKLLRSNLLREYGLDGWGLETF